MARRAIACIGAAVLIAGCGGGGESRRDQVANYIDQANQVQGHATKDLARANKAYVAFSQRKLAPSAAAKKLAKPERTIRATRAELARIVPPPDARELHRRLLRLYDLDAGLADETAVLARYLPGAGQALRPLAGINTRLRNALRSAKNPNLQVAALRRFGSGIGRIVARLRTLTPPPLLKPTHRAQIARLVQTERLSQRLRRAIDARDAKRVARILLSFRRTNGSGSAGATSVERAAFSAYQRRYEALRKAEYAVARERLRLDRSLR